MKKIIVLISISAGMILSSCGGSGKDSKKDPLAELRQKLEKLNKEKTTVEENIRQVKDEMAKVDPEAAKNELKLVSADTLRKRDFTHFIELQGKIDADDIVLVTPRSIPGQVRQLYVKKGDHVQKGQLLIKLDDAVMLQQLDALKTQLAFAENLYNRQKGLWDQGIGTEVQVITAKNSVDALNRQIGTLKETWQTSFIYAPITGVADEVNIKVGEIFSGGTSSSPQIKLINGNSLKIVTEVPENYISRVRKGMLVEVVVPESGRAPFKSSISVIGSSINPNTRAFITEAKLPADPVLKPNQLATMRIQDYQSKNALAVPVNIVQSDEKGKYVYVIEKTGDKQIARKKEVNVGESFEGLIEIKGGLAGGEQLITEGYQTVYDGQVVTTGK